MNEEPPKRGRPAGKDYPFSRTLLLTEQDNADLNALAQAWGCSSAAAVRRLIREKVREMRQGGGGE